MDTNRIGAQVQDIGGDADAADWRTQLQEASRQTIVNNTMDALKRHLPFAGQEGLQELKKIATRFEEKCFARATSEHDYLRIISLKMLPLETRSQNPTDNSVQFNAPGNTSQTTHDPGRTQLQEASRQTIVNNTVYRMDALKRHLPFAGQEGLQEIATRFEEKCFARATSEHDYLTIISLKMLALETRSQNPTDNSVQFNAAGNTSQTTHDPVL